MNDSEKQAFVRLEDALLGNRNEAQQRLAQSGLEVIDTLLRKNRDYGCSAWQPPVLMPEMPPEEALLVRLSDKVQRLRTLMDHGYGEPEVAESIRDTMADLAGYALLWLAMPEEGQRGET